jgi:hypothetical protein
MKDRKTQRRDHRAAPVSVPNERAFMESDDSINHQKSLFFIDLKKKGWLSWHIFLNIIPERSLFCFSFI